MSDIVSGHLTLTLPDHLIENPSQAVPTPVPGPVPTDPDAPQHLVWPPRLTQLPDGSTSYATVEQDDLPEIRQSFRLIATLRRDQLPWDRELGIPDPLGTTDPQAAASRIETALAYFETRHPITVQVADGPRGRQVHLRLVSADA